MKDKGKWVNPPILTGSIENYFSSLRNEKDGIERESAKLDPLGSSIEGSMTVEILK